MKRVFTIQAEVNVEVEAQNAAEARALFAAHVKALDASAQIAIGDDGVYTWTRFWLAEKGEAVPTPVEREPS